MVEKRARRIFQWKSRGQTLSKKDWRQTILDQVCSKFRNHYECNQAETTKTMILNVFVRFQETNHNTDQKLTQNHWKRWNMAFFTADKIRQKKALGDVSPFERVSLWTETQTKKGEIKTKKSPPRRHKHEQTNTWTYSNWQSPRHPQHQQQPYKQQ